MEYIEKKTNWGLVAVIILAVLLIGLNFFEFYYFRSYNQDIRAISDVNQLRNVLELNNLINSTYPVVEKPVMLGDNDSNTMRLCASGFTSLTQPCDKLLLAPIPISNPASKYWYFSKDGKDYQIQFDLLQNESLLGLGKGTQCATRSGIAQGKCFETQ